MPQGFARAQRMTSLERLARRKSRSPWREDGTFHCA